VAGVVLVDTYTPQSNFVGQFGLALMDGMSQRQAAFDVFDDDRLTAMGWYLDLFGGWQPRRTTCPTLLVRCREPLSEAAVATATGDWRSSWPLPHEVVDVDGNHFSVLEERCQETATAITAWIAAAARESFKKGA
jgi:hypothetical protein